VHLPVTVVFLRLGFPTGFLSIKSVSMTVDFFLSHACYTPCPSQHFKHNYSVKIHNTAFPVTKFSPFYYYCGLFLQHFALSGHLFFL
jgi:hypothetical protein